MSIPIRPVAPGVTATPPPENTVPLNSYELASPAVQMTGVAKPLESFLQYLGLLHRMIFNKVLIVTSGKDSVHVASSLHGQGLAVDIRTRDLLPDEQALLLHLLAFAGPANHIAIFDERALGAEAHIHLEYHG